ncbi:MAG: hypothetical protein WBI63_05410 [Coriobacteriia bacterium]
MTPLFEDRRGNPTLFGCGVASLVGVVFWVVVIALAVRPPVGTILAVILVAFRWGNYV